MAGEEQLFTRGEMESIFARRQIEHRQLLADAAELLNPQLERMTDQIAASNHVKEQLRQELEELTAAVRLSQKRLEDHVRLPSHAVGARMIHSLGLETMSEEERAAFPDAMRAALDARKQAVAQDNSNRKRIDLQLVIATGVGSLASLLMFGIAVLAFVFSRGGFA